MKKLLSIIYTRRSYIAIMHDCIMAALSFYLALYLRYEHFLDTKAYYIRFGLPVFTVVCLGTFVFMKLYRGLWRYASLQDLMAIVKAVTLAVIIFMSLIFFYERLDTIPRSVIAINWMLLIVLLGAPRFAYRLSKDGGISFDMINFQDTRIPVLLIGAGNQAELFMRDSSNKKEFMYRVVGLVDEDRSTHGRNIRGVRVYGAIDSLARIIDKLERKGVKPQRIIITDESVTGDIVKEILEISQSRGVLLSRLPSLTEFKSGEKTSLEPKPVAIEDLLGRAQNKLDYNAMREFITGKHVLVTGGGGTIGGEIAMQTGAFAPASITILDNSEFNLYECNNALKSAYPDLQITQIYADVRDNIAINKIFAHHKPDIIFHTAAIKHVPIAEINPSEAVLTNVFGTANVISSALENRVKNLVVISTDKAVNPTGVMGASKRLMEIITQRAAGLSSAESKINTVRFGNVLASRGSVIPLFEQQIAGGGPVTLSHNDITRYFMTLREAVGLVILSSTLRNNNAIENGAIFVLEMGEPVRIRDMAEQMIRLSGSKVDIVVTGLRAGEKMFEELFYKAESPSPSTYSGINIAKPIAFNQSDFDNNLEELRKFALERNNTKATEMLFKMIYQF